MRRRGIRHDKVNHHHPLTDFSYTLFFPVEARDNNITLLLTVMPVLGYTLCWQQLKYLRYLPLGARSHPSWFVYYLQLCCLGLGQLAYVERGFLEEQHEAGSGLGRSLPCPRSCTWHWHAEWFRTRLSLPPFPFLWNVDGGAYFTNCMKLCSCQALYVATHDSN